MDMKGQGAIEYLLIIAAAILVVAIVILALTGALGSGQDQSTQAITDQNTQQNQLRCMNDCNALGTDKTAPGSCYVLFSTECS